MNLFLGLGAISAIVSPTVSITSNETQLDQFDNHISIKHSLSDHYDVSKKGFIKLVSDGQTISKSLTATNSAAANFYEMYPAKADAFTKQINMMLKQRGFFSFFDNVFKTIGSSIAAAVTFGQVDSINKLVINSAKGVKDNAMGALKTVGGIAETVVGAGSLLDGNGDGITDVTSGTKDIVDNFI